MAEPVKLPRVSEAYFLNAYLGHTEKVFDLLLDELGDGSPEKLGVKELENAGEEKPQTGELAEKYNGSKEKVEKYKDDWHSLDTNVSEISGKSAGIVDTVRTEINDLVGEIEEIVQAVSPKPDIGTQMSVISSIDKAIDGATTSIQNAWEKLDQQSAGVGQDGQNGNGNTSPMGNASPMGGTSPVSSGGNPSNSGSGVTQASSDGAAQAQPMGDGQKAKAEEIYKRLTEKHGLSPAQAAGVIGNMQVESNFKTGATNPAEGAIGLCQWQGGRRQALEAFAASQGRPVTDWEVQVDFMMQEMQSGESGAYQQLKGTQSPGDAAAAFDQHYERSSGEARGERVANANSFAQSMSNSQSSVAV